MREVKACLGFFGELPGCHSEGCGGVVCFWGERWGALWSFGTRVLRMLQMESLKELFPEKARRLPSIRIDKKVQACEALKQSDSKDNIQ